MTDEIKLIFSPSADMYHKFCRDNSIPPTQSKVIYVSTNSDAINFPRVTAGLNFRNCKVILLGDVDDYYGQNIEMIKRAIAEGARFSWKEGETFEEGTVRHELKKYERIVILRPINYFNRCLSVVHRTMKRSDILDVGD